MRLYDPQWDSNIEGGPGAPLFVVLGVASLAVSVVLVALCTCYKSSSDDSEKSNNANNVKRKKNANLKVNVGLRPDADVEIDIITPQSNGSVGTATSHDRPKSHDRALPEIPAVGVSPRTGDDDEDDDTDGLYDVISKRPKNRQHANGSVTKAIAGPPQNPYELVPETMMVSSQNGAVEIEPVQPIYAMSSKAVARASSSSSSRQGSPRLPSRDEEGAIGGFDDANSEDSSVFYAAPQKKRHSYERVQDVPKLDTESVNTLNISVNSGPAPPIPSKHYIPDQGNSDVCIHGDPALVLPNGNHGNISPAVPSNPSLLPGHSNPGPGLLLRNSIAGVNNGASTSINIHASSHSDQSSGPLSLTGQPALNGNLGNGGMASGVTVGYPSNGMASGAAGPAKKEPPYHKVTVRESLANVRLREAEERRRKGLPPAPDRQGEDAVTARRGHSPALVLLQSGSSTDVDYDQINYDQIKSPGASGGTSGGGDTGSELYAEIGGAEAPSSTRSSTYAAVGEGSALLCAVTTPPSDHAPTPPPVDSLKQITETLDPGYSQIGVPQRRPHQRPHSTVSSSSSGHYDNAPGYAPPPGPETGAPAVYAEVRKKRATIHGGDANKRPLTDDELRLLYAKVNKPNRGTIGGARPKVLVDPRDPGYSTIDSASGGTSVPASVVSDNNNVLHTDGDFYELVEDKNGNENETESEYDPNYERMGNIARVPMESSASGSASNSQPLATSPGVAREIPGGAAVVDSSLNDQGMVHVSYNSQSKPSVFDRPGLIREHIYQEIPDTNKRPRKGKESANQREVGGKKKGQSSKRDNLGAGKKS